MAQKKTYLYRMLIGNSKNDIKEDLFLYARNSELALKYCKEKYKKQKYSFYKPIKVGISLNVRDVGEVSKEDDEKLRTTIASMGESFREKEVAMPQFITKEEAGDLI